MENYQELSDLQLLKEYWALAHRIARIEFALVSLLHQVKPLFQKLRGQEVMFGNKLIEFESYFVGQDVDEGLLFSPAAFTQNVLNQPLSEQKQQLIDNVARWVTIDCLRTIRSVLPTLQDLYLELSSAAHEQIGSTYVISVLTLGISLEPEVFRRHQAGRIATGDKMQRPQDPTPLDRSRTMEKIGGKRTKLARMRNAMRSLTEVADKTRDRAHNLRQQVRWSSDLDDGQPQGWKQIHKKIEASLLKIAPSQLGDNPSHWKKTVEEWYDRCVILGSGDLQACIKSLAESVHTGDWDE